VHSAELAFGGKYPIIIDARLRECDYGEYNGQPSAIVEPLQEQMINQKFPGGESYEDVEVRVDSFLEDLKKNHDEQHVAIIAHKAPQLALEVLLNSKTWQEAFDTDWRKSGHWQPGWEYTLS
jgi:broad specificity phosphatase PhoE